MKLLYTPIAGYVHTVEAVIHYAALQDQIELIPTRPFDSGTALQKINPLGKVPTLHEAKFNLTVEKAPPPKKVEPKKVEPKKEEPKKDKK